MSDSLSQLFSHIQNGQRNRILTVESAKTKLVLAILNILQEHGYIRGYRFHHNASNKLQILLKYKNQKPAINKIIRISKPSKRVYISSCADSAGTATQLLKQNKIKLDKLCPTLGPHNGDRAMPTGGFSFQTHLPLSHSTQCLPRTLGAHSVGSSKRGQGLGHESQVTNGRCFSYTKQDPIFFMQGILILSTSKGVWDHLTARRLGAGGEVLCHVY